MVEILPHDSAETSNTDSNLTDGVLYGFFAPRLFRCFLVRIIIFVQLSLPRFNFEILAFADVAQDVIQPPISNDTGPCK